VFDELMATGAVLVGRRTFELARGWNGDHHDGVPIFVPTHRPPDDPPRGAATITFVTDGIEAAVAKPRPPPGTRTSCCTAPTPPSSACAPGCSTSWRSTWSLSSSGRAAACSTTSARTTSSPS
jgi:hypothetical protein